MTNAQGSDGNDRKMDKERWEEGEHTEFKKRIIRIAYICGTFCPVTTHNSTQTLE